MFWRKKANEAAVSGSRLAAPVAKPIADDQKLVNKFEEILTEVGRSTVCIYCQRDVRSETVLTIRYISSFFAMFPGGAGSKVETLTLDDQTKDPWLGFSICTSCALTRNIPGLDRAKLSALLAGLHNTNPEKH